MLVSGVVSFSATASGSSRWLRGRALLTATPADRPAPCDGDPWCEMMVTENVHTKTLRRAAQLTGPQKCHTTRTSQTAAAKEMTAQCGTTQLCMSPALRALTSTAQQRPGLRSSNIPAIDPVRPTSTLQQSQRSSGQAPPEDRARLAFLRGCVQGPLPMAVDMPSRNSPAANTVPWPGFGLGSDREMATAADTSQWPGCRLPRSGRRARRNAVNRVARV